MKTILRIFVLLACVFGSSVFSVKAIDIADDHSPELIELYVEMLNDETPIDIPPLCSITSAKIEDGNVVLSMTLTMEVINGDYLRNNPKATIQAFIRGIPAEQRGFARWMFDELNDNNATFVVRVTLPHENATIDITMNAAELSSMLQEVSTPHISLQDPVELMVGVMNRISYPMDLGYGIIMEKIKIHDKIVEYTLTMPLSGDNIPFVLSEDIFLKAYIDNIAQEIVENEDFVYFLRDVKKYGYKMLYTFSFKDTDKSVSERVNFEDKLEETTDKYAGIIDMIIKKTNVNLPKSADDGLVFTDIKRSGSEIVFVYEITSPHVKYSDFENTDKILPDAMLMNLVEKLNDTSMIDIMRAGGYDMRLNLIFPNENRARLSTLRKNGEF